MDGGADGAGEFRVYSCSWPRRGSGKRPRRSIKDMVASLDPATAESALRKLRITLAEHHGGDRVMFGARTWIITARAHGT